MKLSGLFPNPKRNPLGKKKNVWLLIEAFMARNLAYQWEVLTFDASIMRVVFLHSIGREEIYFTVVSRWHCTMYKQNYVGPQHWWKEIHISEAEGILRKSLKVALWGARCLEFRWGKKTEPLMGKFTFSFDKFLSRILKTNDEKISALFFFKSKNKLKWCRVLPKAKELISSKFFLVLFFLLAIKRGNSLRNKS